MPTPAGPLPPAWCCWEVTTVSPQLKRSRRTAPQLTALSWNILLGKYEVRYIIKYQHFYFSRACAINLGSSVIITGGHITLTTVSEYNEEGWVKDLPFLQQSRYNHGCTYFKNDERTKVDFEIFFYSRMIFQTMLVTGGWTGSDFLSSTELLVGTASSWVLTGDLPSPRYGLRGANIDNRVIMTGKYFTELFNKHLKN